MTDTPKKILIVDDEEDICEILQFNLEGEGFITEIANSAEEALTKDLSSFSLILLDVMMGQLSGFKFAEKVRKEFKITIPIIFITAKASENDLLTGFSLGGDDYINKPFSIKEVIARVKALIKRTADTTPAPPENLVYENLELHIEGKKLLINKQEVELTKKEYEILFLLLSNIGRIFSREDILSRVWNDEVIVNDRTVDVHIARLRKKAGAYGNHIKSKPGYGYSFKQA
jgi:DNA-binding response OmpR family regulator